VPVTLHWNGSVWTEVANPVRTPQGGDLSDVVAISRSTLYAAGSAISNGVERPLLLRWNGSAWVEVPAAGAGSEPVLRSIAAVGAGTIWAAGSHRTGPRLNPGPQRTLTIRTTN
jgi:hypothetical protein